MVLNKIEMNYTASLGLNSCPLAQHKSPLQTDYTQLMLEARQHVTCLHL